MYLFSFFLIFINFVFNLAAVLAIDMSKYITSIKDGESSYEPVDVNSDAEYRQLMQNYLDKEFGFPAKKP